MTLHRCIVEVDDRAVGLLTLESGEYVFHAVVPEAQKLEGTVYPDPEAALRAVRLTLLSGTVSAANGQSATAL